MNLSDHLRERNCPVCGSADRSAILHRAKLNEKELDEFAFASRKIPEFMHLTLVKCPVCSLIYASPAFTPEFLATVYETAGYDSDEEAYYAASTYASLLPSIRRSLLRAESAFEVGSGNGAFLIELKNAGFSTVAGVEPSTAAFSKAKQQVRELIRPGMFNVENFSPSSIDLLACFQTIEHVEDPRGLCAAAFRLLRPGGGIYLVSHDYYSWVTRALGRKSPIFDVEHLQLFSEASLHYMLDSCGFERIEIKTIWNRYPLSYWLKLAPIPKPLKKSMLAVIQGKVIGRLPCALNIGNLAVVGYKPGLR